MNKLMKVKPSVAADKLTEYWSTYNNQYGVDEYSEKTFLDDAIYSIGAVIDKERFRYAQGYDNFKRALYEMLKLEFGNGEWISVDDRLPEKYGEYLCSTKARPEGWIFTYAPLGWICSEDYPVTHWMPLPEPPAKEV